MASVCCDVFDISLGMAGEYGLAVLAYYFSRDNCGFALQSRGIAAKFCRPLDTEISRAEERSTPPRNDMICATDGQNVSWCINTEVPMSFCPWCGANLKALIDTHFEAFFDITEQPKQLEALKRSCIYHRQRAREGFR